MRITKLGAAALAASISFGGAALAFADDAMPADPTVEGELPTTTTTTEDPEPTTTTTRADGEPAEGEPAEGEAGKGAGKGKVDGETKEHPDNHGKTVSEAAHATPPGPGHGKAVSEVARSSNHGHTKAEKAAKVKPKVKDKAPKNSTD